MLLLLVRHCVAVKLSVLSRTPKSYIVRDSDDVQKLQRALAETQDTAKCHGSDGSWRLTLSDKCSAVAEMGDRLATIDMGRKLGGAALPPFLRKEELGPHLTQCGHGRGLPACRVSS